MIYKFETEKKNYSEFASGSVIKSFPGQPAFPVRLSSELFQRCSEILKTEGLYPPYSIYDPFCGSAYMISTLAFLHGSEISNIFCSDINFDSVLKANDNLNLLTQEGIQARIKELESIHNLYNKESHLAAIKSAKFIEAIYLSPNLNSINKKSFLSDAFVADNIEKFIPIHSIDILITDVPYGNQTKLKVIGSETSFNQDLILDFLKSIRSIMKLNGLVVIVDKMRHKNLILKEYVKKNYFKIGQRHIYIYQLKSL